MKEEFDFESIKNKAIEQLKAGKPLLGKDGAFAPLLESILNAALEGEMDAHLTEEERQKGNRRNGKMQKQVQTPLGESVYPVFFGLPFLKPLFFRCKCSVMLRWKTFLCGSIAGPHKIAKNLPFFLTANKKKSILNDFQGHFHIGL
jgi:hypothetical protein